MFAPHFQITPRIAKALMAIEADRQAMAELPIDVAMLASLRETARLAATHYSTQIEGNRLTQAQVREAIAGRRIDGRERDEQEVRHYYRALEKVEALGGHRQAFTEKDIQEIHGLVMTGRMSAMPYREGQNVIRDSRSGAIVYMPPEAKDVPSLMKDLVEWINGELARGELPAPLIAGLAHYQYATIHPYYDGNGRTARLLATLILHRSGYGLKGIYSLEEYYAQNLAGYYGGLETGPSHNYYLGRAEADVTAFLDYFCHGMAESFGAVRAQALKAAKRGGRDWSPELRKLGPRERRLLVLFAGRAAVTSSEMAAHLGVAHVTMLGFCRQWVARGFLEVENASRKGRSYRLGAKYEAMVERAEEVGDEGLEPPTSAV